MTTQSRIRRAFSSNLVRRVTCVIGLMGLAACDAAEIEGDDGPQGVGADELTTYDARGVAAQNVNVTVAGTTASGSYTIRTNWRTVSFNQVVLAVRSTSNANFDFVQNANVRVFGARTFSGTRANLPAGTYSAVVAYTLDGQQWFEAGPKVSFSVGGTTCTPTTCAAKGATCGSTFTRCTAGQPAMSLAVFRNEDIYGAGIGGAHGGSGLSALGGTVRYGEFTSGQIRHALKVVLRARDYYRCCSPIWPATVVDGYANSTTYGGSDPSLGPGALLALLPSFDASTLRTTPAKILAAAFRDYGAYAVDDSYANGWAIAFERGADGRVSDEASRLYGVALYPKDSDPFMSDIVTIFQALQIVTNNAPSAVGGGGTPRAPIPPAIGN